ncbi:hypothetical protein NX801_07300 [Streptomyces sp. LP05-1]|uniref:Cardiolipin synthase N-terminal domain-containing protein n=1 Tax=Streptomyces pyxinae TaxID=2970734 RepID=A0ABT2CDM7_9ACTN|nr:hypothetical protein [Streptomyces sp. LP05-1]MCS0635466.1 hypothetical protein [Streptomyces sp. LP05-1]
MKIALYAVGLYVICVLMLRFRRDGMEWDKALLVGLAVTPLAAGLGWLRDGMLKGAPERGRRWRARRQNRA